MPDDPAPFEAELRSREKQYGANHPAVAESCSNLAILFNQRGEVGAAGEGTGPLTRVDAAGPVASLYFRTQRGSAGVCTACVCSPGVQTQAPTVARCCGGHILCPRPRPPPTHTHTHTCSTAPCQTHTHTPTHHIPPLMPCSTAAPSRCTSAPCASTRAPTAPITRRWPTPSQTWRCCTWNRYTAWGSRGDGTWVCVFVCVRGG
jgi:hypothetical protein